MIKWVRLDDNENILEKQNINEIELKNILKIIKNPSKNLKENSLFMIRQYEKREDKIYAWSSSQRIILNKNEIKVINNKKTIIDRNLKIWSSIEKYFKNESDYPSEFFDYIGYYGYFSYDIINLLSDHVNFDIKYRFPLLILDFPTKFYIQNDDIKLYIDLNEESIKEKGLEIISYENSFDNDFIYHHTDYEDYVKNLMIIKENILEGNIYQANLTQKFTLYKDENIDPKKLFHEIIRENKLPNSAYFNYGDFQIFSLSPELLLKIEDGRVYTKPIKGTRPRKKSKIEDQAMIIELKKSEKENSELSMIVDLIRNEMNKTAISNSVNVKKHAIIETYENVHHLISLIEAKVERSLKSSWRFLLRFIPGGSISGVPKNQAINLLYDIEQYPREIYTGNIGYIGLNGNLQMNIAIRTAVIIQNEIVINSGGGIVMDSEISEEYIESLHKLKHIMKYFGKDFTGHLSILNDKMIETEKIKLDEIKNGFFETILIKKGKIINQKEHELRINNSLDRLFEEKIETYINEIHVHNLVRLNLSDDDDIKLNIYYWKNKEANKVNILYRIKPISIQRNENKLFINTNFIDPPIEVKKFGIKSLNYILYENSTKLAEAHNCWDTINYDSNGFILEGGKSTLYFYKENKWITPKNNVINGVIRSKLIKKEKVSFGDIKLEDLKVVKSIALSNSIVGVVEIHEIYDYNGIKWKSKTSKPLKFLN